MNKLTILEQTVGRRVSGMVMLWLAAGAVVGMLSGAPHRDPLALIAHGIAGVLLLPPIGLLFGLLGGRWKESLVGILFGAAAGMAAPALRSGMLVGAMTGFGMLVGGMTGATLPMFFRLLKSIRTAATAAVSR